jgi:putative membrane protein
MKLVRIAVMAALCATSTVALAQQSETMRTAEASEKHEKLSSPEFVKKAAAAGHAEVKMGKVGVEKATDPEVKAYAQRMVTDHTKANTELATLAKTKNLEVPDSPDMMHKVMGEKFEHQKSGEEFDHDFMKQMVKDHKKAVELYEAASSDKSIDPELNALAKRTLPTLKEHLKQAEALEAKLDK